MYKRGALLRVDLTRRALTREPLPEELCQKYLGGEGINSWLLWQHFLSVSPNIDPLSPNNVLIIGPGVLSGTGYGGGSKMKWTFKSPAYNLFGDSSSGGFWGSALRWAGYDHLVITGRAEAPVYLWIDDDKVEIREAAHLWGRDPWETAHLIHQETGCEGVETVCIGIAGENLVRFACIIVGHRGAGRGGGGAVMGSKNLKAIAVRGSKGLAVHDPSGFLNAIDEMKAAQAKVLPRSRDSWKKFGTIQLVESYQRLGLNPYRNGQFGNLPEEKCEKLSHKGYWERMAVSALSCSPGCSWACSGGYRRPGQEWPDLGLHGPLGIKPELGALESFGVIGDIADFGQVSQLWDLCNKYGMDAIEAGGTCAFLMELWQRGLLNETNVARWAGAPLRMEWGNYEAAVKVIESIARQNSDLGRFLRGGVFGATQQLGMAMETDLTPYALYGKGGATFCGEVRHMPSQAVSLAVASRGADHLKAFGTLDRTRRPDISEYYFGTPDGATPLSTKLKGASSALAENRTAIMNCLGVCNFLQFYDPIAYPLDMFCHAIYALTGMPITATELAKVGERVVNLEKAFNSRLGLRREHDNLCPRWRNEELVSGMGRGWKCSEYLEPLKDEYYEYHGWDKATSLQTRHKLESLDMADVASVLEAEGLLPP